MSLRTVRLVTVLSCRLINSSAVTALTPKSPG